MDAVIQKDISLPALESVIMEGFISKGIEFPMHKPAIITENELFKNNKTSE